LGFRKYTEAKPIKPIVGDEADVLVTAMRREGKFALSEFTDEELDSLDEELEARRKAIAESQE
jgi:hypothetical protein